MIKLFILTVLLLSTTYCSKVTMDKTAIAVDKGTTQTIKFTLDEPIICNNVFQECAVVILLTNPLTNKVTLNNCQIKWLSIEWNQPRYLNISSVENFINDGPLSSSIITSPIISNSDYYNSTIISNITIQILPKPSGSCSGTGDPHYTTFDGAYWNIYWQGTYVLYKSLIRDFEVQVMTRGYPAQHCGFAVKENNDIIVVSHCDGQNIIRRTCGTSTCLMSDLSAGGFPKLLSSGSSYIAQLQSGASVTLNFYTSTFGNIYIVAPSQDHNATVGVCGNFNDNPNDDVPIYISTSSSSFPSNYIPQTDLFNWYPSNVINIVQSPHIQECNYTPIYFTPPIISQGDSEDITNAIKNLINIPVINTNITTVYNYTDSPISTINYTTAYITCNNSIYQSTTLSVCNNLTSLNITKYVVNCAEDLFLADDYSFVQQALDGLKSDCLSIISSSVNITNITITQLQNLCPTTNNGICNNQGICNLTNCYCNNNFTGTDCSINKNSQPTLYSIGGSAVFQNTLDTYLIINGDNFWNSGDIKCIFNSIPAGEFAKISITNGSYLTSKVILCDSPNITNNNINPLYLSINILMTPIMPITNSNLIITLYNPICKTYINQTFANNLSSCIINNQCYINNTINTYNPCMRCNNNSPSNWSYYYPNLQECYPKFTQSIVEITLFTPIFANNPFYSLDAFNQLTINDTSTVTYSIGNNTLFNINSKTGEIYSQSNITTNLTSTLIVYAYDKYNNSDVMELVINIKKNKFFENDSYVFNIYDNSSLGHIIGSIKTNTESKYYGIESSLITEFNINSTSGDLFVNKKLNYSVVQSYNFVVYAIDIYNNYGYVSVTINIIETFIAMTTTTTTQVSSSVTSTTTTTQLPYQNTIPFVNSPYNISVELINNKSVDNIIGYIYAYDDKYDIDFKSNDTSIGFYYTDCVSNNFTKKCSAAIILINQLYGNKIYNFVATNELSKYNNIIIDINFGNAPDSIITTITEITTTTVTTPSTEKYISTTLIPSTIIVLSNTSEFYVADTYPNTNQYGTVFEIVLASVIGSFFLILIIVACCMKINKKRNNKISSLLSTEDLNTINIQVQSIGNPLYSWNPSSVQEFDKKIYENVNESTDYSLYDDINGIYDNNLIKNIDIAQ